MITLSLSSLAYGGSAVGRHEGKAIFVPYALPGEDVLAEITEDKGRYARARLVEVVTPSPQRVPPPCPHFGPDRCGSCHWQHVAYPAQLAFKADILREQLRRLGGIADPPVQPAVGMDDPWRYRNHVQLGLDNQGRPGFQAANSNRIVPISGCLLMHPLLWELCSTFQVPGSMFPHAQLETWNRERKTIPHRLILRAGLHTGQQMMILDGKANRPFIEERLSGRTFRVSAESFFQVNTRQAERLVELATAYLEPERNQVLLDLFCGVGTFGLLLAGRVKRVIGIEESYGAIQDALANAAGLTNVRLLRGKAQVVLPSLSEKIDAVILDPPREGCDLVALKALIRLAPRRIVYVSCDPSTLARDVRRLAEAGYVLREATPVDMFPQTYHLETVAVLDRRNP